MWQGATRITKTPPTMFVNRHEQFPTGVTVTLAILKGGTTMHIRVPMKLSPQCVSQCHSGPRSASRIPDSMPKRPCGSYYMQHDEVQCRWRKAQPAAPRLIGGKHNVCVRAKRKKRCIWRRKALHLCKHAYMRCETGMPG